MEKEWLVLCPLSVLILLNLIYRDAIVAWVKKKMESGIHNITTTVEAESILTIESKIVLGFLDSLEVFLYLSKGTLLIVV